MLVWQIEENGNLLDDLREWNKHADLDDQVRFIGCDAQDGSAVVKRLSQLLGEDNVSVVQQLKGLQLQLEDAMRKAMQGNPSALDALLKEAQLQTKKVRKLVAPHSKKLDEIEIRLQEFEANLGLYSAIGQREKVMAELLLAQIDKDDAAGKCVFWGHNGHVQRANLTLGGRFVPAMGGHLAKTLGNRYYAIGFDFGRGEFQANTRDAKGRWRFRRYRHSGPPKGSMAELFSKTPHDFIIDFRSVEGLPAVDDWLRSSQTFRSWGGYNVPNDFDDPKKRPLPMCRPGTAYDAMAFHHKTTAAKPLDPDLVIE